MPTPENNLLSRLQLMHRKMDQLRGEFTAPYHVTEKHTRRMYVIPCSQYSVWFKTTLLFTTKSRVRAQNVARECNAAYQMGQYDALIQLDIESHHKV